MARPRCAQWRYEQLTVAMALAAALHHSAGPKVEMQQDAALRGLNTGTRANGEEVLHDAHDAPRGQTTPPPGMRPGSLSDPWPQRNHRIVRRSAWGAPPVALSSLAGGDATDDTTVAFLLSASLSKEKEEEEEARWKGEEELRDEERKMLEAEERKRAKTLKG